MFVVSRKIGERLDFYHPATGMFSVQVRKVAGNRVTLACDAPGEVKIYRGELVDSAGGIYGAGGIHGVGTESPSGNEAPPAAVAFLCQAVGYPASDCVVRATDAKAAAEEFAREVERSVLTPMNVRVQRSVAYEPTATYRVERSSCGGCVASLIAISTVIEPREVATFKGVYRPATAQEIFENGVYEREGA